MKESIKQISSEVQKFIQEDVPDGRHLALVAASVESGEILSNMTEIDNKTRHRLAKFDIKAGGETSMKSIVHQGIEVCHFSRCILVILTDCKWGRDKDSNSSLHDLEKNNLTLKIVNIRSRNVTEELQRIFNINSKPAEDPQLRPAEDPQLRPAEDKTSIWEKVKQPMFICAFVICSIIGICLCIAGICITYHRNPSRRTGQRTAVTSGGEEDALNFRNV